MERIFKFKIIVIYFIFINKKCFININLLLFNNIILLSNKILKNKLYLNINKIKIKR